MIKRDRKKKRNGMEENLYILGRGNRNGKEKVIIQEKEVKSREENTVIRKSKKDDQGRKKKRRKRKRKRMEDRVKIKKQK